MKKELTILSQDDLAKKLTAPITGGWFLYGDEEYLVSYYAKEIRKNVIGDDEFGEFNRIVIDSQKIDVAEIENALSSLPMMSDRKIVEILYPYLYKKDKKKKDSDTDDSEETSVESDDDINDALINVISHLEEYPHAILLIVVNKDCFYEGASSNMPSALLKNIGKYMNVVKFPIQTEAKLKRWAFQHFKRENILSNEESLDYLLYYCGLDMRNLKNEISKLIAYCHCNNISSLTVNEIKLVSSPGLDEGSFELSNAIMRGEKDKAYNALLGYKLRKEPAIVVLASISSTLSDMLKISTLKKGGYNQDEIAKALGINPYRVGIFLKSISGVDPDRIRITLERCRLADEYMKTGGMDYDAIERLIATIPKFVK